LKDLSLATEEDEAIVAEERWFTFTLMSLLLIPSTARLISEALELRIETKLSWCRMTNFFSTMGQATQKRNLRPTMSLILFYRSSLDFILGQNESSEPFLTGDQVKVVQFNNQLILLSGKGSNLPVNLDFKLGQKVQKWNGEETSDFVIDENIPNGDFGVVTGNRLAIKTSNDVISFSDIANESNYDVLAKFTFGAGDGDDIIGMSPIPENAALVFKRRSIWAISGLNSIENAFITQVSRQTGCVSMHSIQNVGSAVFFLGDGGVYAMDIGLDASNALGTLTRFDLRDEPLSKAINDQILAEDFTEAENSCRSVFFNNRYYLSFLKDGVSHVYIFQHPHGGVGKP
jgi:hypothetical protein